MSKVYLSLENLTGERVVESHLTSALNLMEDYAKMDPLTELPNRRELDKLFSIQFEIAREKNKGIGLAFLDLDNLKILNDTYGHQFGDLVLSRLGKTLKQSCRGDDNVGRWGGDEFVFIGLFNNMKEIKLTMNRIYSNFQRMKRNEFVDMENEFGLSIGATYLSQDEREVVSIDALLERADTALYIAKNGGRNQISYSWEQKV